MSSKVIVLLEDDVDGTKADQTVEFEVDGRASPNEPAAWV
jgi:hypothetical protein